MKIAYINFFYSRNNMIGVEKKLVEEACHYAHNGVDVYLLNDKEEGFRDNILYKNVYNYFSLPSFLGYFYVRLFTYDIIEKTVPVHEYDKIYLRYPLMDFSSLGFAGKYGAKLITQHHTKELEEIRAYKFNPLLRYTQYILEKWLAPKFFCKVHALTAMSDEVILYEIERLGFTGKTYRFSNGINPQTFIMRTPPAPTDIFHITIVASHYSPWHGLDRLLKSLEQYQDENMKIHLHVIGELGQKDLQLVENIQKSSWFIIELHGKLFSEDLDVLFGQTHMACDSLAMYRLGMHESSTLKSKEYVARGIPFIYSAFDQDMQDIKVYLYDAKNSDELLDFSDIITHYQKLDLQKMQEVMKRCVDEVLDWKIKVRKLVNFLEEERVSK